MMGAVVLSGLVFSSTEVRADDVDERIRSIEIQRNGYRDKAKTLRNEYVNRRDTAQNQRGHGQDHFEQAIGFFKDARGKLKEAHQFEKKAMIADLDMRAVRLAEDVRKERLTEDQYAHDSIEVANDSNLELGLAESLNHAELLEIKDVEKLLSSSLGIRWVDVD